VLTSVALVSVMAGAAAAADPITGAFGLSFDTPVPETLLGASLADSPYPLPPANLNQSLPERIPGRMPAWYLFSPEALPDLLDDPIVRFMVMVDGERRPVRILAEHPQPDCASDTLWLTRSIAQKYRAENDPFGAERDGFARSARFIHKNQQVDVSCGPALLVEYTHAGTYENWRQSEALAHETYRRQKEQLQRLELDLQLERDRQFAETFTAGERFRLEGVWGVHFGVPFTRTQTELLDAATDEPISVELRDLSPPFAEGSFTLTLGPDQLPVKIVGIFPDADARLFQQVVAALRAKYGSPLKDGDTHKIHKINGDHLVARYDATEQKLHMTFINGRARRAQKERLLLAQQQQFEEETAGL